MIIGVCPFAAPRHPRHTRVAPGSRRPTSFPGCSCRSYRRVSGQSRQAARPNALDRGERAALRPRTGGRRTRDPGSEPPPVRLSSRSRGRDGRSRSGPGRSHTHSRNRTDDCSRRRNRQDGRPRRRARGRDPPRGRTRDSRADSRSVRSGARTRNGHGGSRSRDSPRTRGGATGSRCLGSHGVHGSRRNAVMSVEPVSATEGTRLARRADRRRLDTAARANAMRFMGLLREGHAWRRRGSLGLRPARACLDRSGLTSPAQGLICVAEGSIQSEKPAVLSG